MEAGIRWRLASEGEIDKRTVQRESKWGVGVKGEGKEECMKDGEESGEIEWYWNERMMKHENDD